jgi:hypothetical protein
MDTQISAAVSCAPRYADSNCMAGRRYLAVSVFLLLLGGASAQQVTVAGRAVDENGAPVAGARIELRSGSGALSAASSDAAGDFLIKVAAPGEYEIRAERQGFYLVHGKTSRFDETSNLLTVTLNHEREFSERVDVTASPPNVDPQQPAARQELDNTEILAIPYPAPRTTATPYLWPTA